MNFLISEEEPENFSKQLDVSGCFCVHKTKFLILKRSRSQSGTWSIPSGRSEVGESPLKAVVRETQEETGFVLKDPAYLGKIFVKYENIDYVFYMFWKSFENLPEVTLSDEHTDYCWVTPEEALKMPLIFGGLEAVQFFIKQGVIDHAAS